MTELDTTTPSRELDAAVARALGKDVRQADDSVFTSSRDWTEPNDYYIARADGGADLLPAYSKPVWLEDRAALLDCVLWLARRGYAVEYDEFAYEWNVRQTNYDDRPRIADAPGTDDAAFALCVCRAAVMIGARG